MRPQNSEPFWLPAGSVRALLHFIVVCVAVYTLVVDGENEWAYGLIVSVLGLYGLQKAGGAVTDITKSRLGVPEPMNLTPFSTPEMTEEQQTELKRREQLGRENEDLSHEKLRLEVQMLRGRAALEYPSPENTPETFEPVENDGFSGRAPGSGWGE